MFYLTIELTMHKRIEELHHCHKISYITLHAARHCIDAGKKPVVPSLPVQDISIYFWKPDERVKLCAVINN